MTELSPVRAVVFDMDGLLIDSERLAMESLVSAGAELGYDMPYDFCRSMIGVPADRCRELASVMYGPTFPLNDYFELHDEHLRRLVDDGKLATKPGATALLEHLGKLGIPKAIATSSSRARADHHLQLAGLEDHFDVIVTRQDVSEGKPHPEPYLKATAALGADPEHTLALEDSLNGIRAAHAAGLRCVLIPDLVQPTEESRRLAVRLFPDLHHVIGYLATTNAYPAEAVAPPS